MNIRNTAICKSRINVFINLQLEDLWGLSSSIALNWNLIFLNTDSYVKNDSEMFFINNGFGADGYFSSYSQFYFHISSVLLWIFFSADQFFCPKTCAMFFKTKFLGLEIFYEPDSETLTSSSHEGRFEFQSKSIRGLGAKHPRNGRNVLVSIKNVFRIVQKHEYTILCYTENSPLLVICCNEFWKQTCTYAEIIICVFYTLISHCDILHYTYQISL